MEGEVAIALYKLNEALINRGTVWEGDTVHDWDREATTKV